MAAVLNTHIIELTQFVNVRPYALSTAQSSPDLASGLINEPSIDQDHDSICTIWMWLAFLWETY